MPYAFVLDFYVLFFLACNIENLKSTVGKEKEGPAYDYTTKTEPGYDYSDNDQGLQLVLNPI